jgi:hypothetical protein
MAKATSSKYSLGKHSVSSNGYNTQKTEEVHNFQFSTLTHSDDDRFIAKKTECGVATDKKPQNLMGSVRDLTSLVQCVKYTRQKKFSNFMRMESFHWPLLLISKACKK